MGDPGKTCGRAQQAARGRRGGLPVLRRRQRGRLVAQRENRDSRLERLRLGRAERSGSAAEAQGLGGGAERLQRGYTELEQPGGQVDRGGDLSFGFDGRGGGYRDCGGDSA